MSELNKINNSDLISYLRYIADTFNDNDTRTDAGRIEHFLQNGINVEQWTPFLHGIVAGLQMKHNAPLEEYLSCMKLDKKTVRRLKLEKLNNLSK